MGESKSINREMSGNKSRSVECVTTGFYFLFCGRNLASRKAVKINGEDKAYNIPVLSSCVTQAQLAIVQVMVYLYRRIFCPASCRETSFQLLD